MTSRANDDGNRESLGLFIREGVGLDLKALISTESLIQNVAV